MRSPQSGPRGKLEEREADLRKNRYSQKVNKRQRVTGVPVAQRKRYKPGVSFRVQKRITKWKQKAKDLTAKLKAVKRTVVRQKAASVKVQAVLENKIKGLLKDIAEMIPPDEAGVDTDVGFVSFKDPDGSIQFELSITIMELVILGVSQRTIWPAVKTVYERLSGNRVDMSVSKGAIYYATHRLGVLTDFQLGYLLKAWAAADMSAFHDGTSHRGRSIQGSQLQLGGTIFSLGVGEVEDGTAVTSFNDFVRRIEKACKLPGIEEDVNEVRTLEFQLHKIVDNAYARFS